jgi:threonylcarbamoyladenosine tRNA methylthiotransferase MtaB
MSARTFYIANFGCRASQSEGSGIEQELLESEASGAESPYEAEVVVVNSCTVTAEADREARQLIRRVAARNPAARIIVTGCYAQRAPEEIAALPGVRYVVGNSHKPLVGKLAMSVMAMNVREEEDFGSHGRAEILCSSIFLERELKPGSHSGSGGRTRAIVKVQDGCNANCSFCVIPSVRGRSRSMEPDLVIGEVQALVMRGYKEVVFSGIHLGTYGRDLGTKSSLYALVSRMLDSMPQLERLRLSSIEPLEVTSEIIELVTSHPRVARHLHIPLQSGSSRILREMRRPYTPVEYGRLIERVRALSEETSIGADVMVGFPGESDAEFSETYALIERLPMTYLHVFPYSSRPGTVAASLPNPVPDHVSRFRAKALRELIAGKNEIFRRSMIGRTFPALVLEPGEALSTNFIRTHVSAELPQNRWTDIRVTGVTTDGLQA